MPSSSVSVERHPGLWAIRLERNFDLGFAATLQTALLEGLAAGVSLTVDVETCGFTVPLLQLLCAAKKEAQVKGVEMTVIASQELTRCLPLAGLKDVLCYTAPSASQVSQAKRIDVAALS